MVVLSSYLHYNKNVRAQITIPLGVGAVCFILAWISFTYHDDAQTGWVFVGIGLFVVVLGLVLGRRKE